MLPTIRSAALAAACLLSAGAACAQQGIIHSTETNALFRQPPVFAPDARADALFKGNVSTYKDESPYAPGPWQTVREQDVRWSKRVWSSLSLRDSANAALNTVPGGEGFAGMLIQAALSGQFKAYSSADDRFTTQLGPEQLQKLFFGEDKVCVLDPASAFKLRIREDWIYIASKHQLEARIVGIAPVALVRNEKGEKVEQVLFWVYYPEARPYFATQPLTDAGGAQTDNVDKLLEERRFTAAVVKTAATRNDVTYFGAECDFCPY